MKCDGCNKEILTGEMKYYCDNNKCGNTIFVLEYCEECAKKQRFLCSCKSQFKMRKVPPRYGINTGTTARATFGDAASSWEFEYMPAWSLSTASITPITYSREPVVFTTIDEDVDNDTDTDIDNFFS